MNRVCLFVLDRREHDDGGGSGRVCALLGGKGCLFLEKILGWWKEREKSGRGTRGGES